MCLLGFFVKCFQYLHSFLCLNELRCLSFSLKPYGLNSPKAARTGYILLWISVEKHFCLINQRLLLCLVSSLKAYLMSGQSRNMALNTFNSINCAYKFILRNIFFYSILYILLAFFMHLFLFQGKGDIQKDDVVFCCEGGFYLYSLCEIYSNCLSRGTI